MNQDLKSIPRLADIEREVVGEAREWGRQRLQERLQQLASQSGEVFSPAAAQTPHAWKVWRAVRCQEQGRRSLKSLLAARKRSQNTL